MGSGIAEAQVDALSDSEFSALMELYEALRLAPGNGRLHVEGGNMYTWDHKGISVTYILLDPQREVAVLRVDRFPVLGGPPRLHALPQPADRDARDLHGPGHGDQGDPEGDDLNRDHQDAGLDQQRDRVAAEVEHAAKGRPAAA